MMPNRSGNYLLIVALFFCEFCFATTRGSHLGFGFDNDKKRVVIPFSSYNNLIIIESIIDEKNKLNLILDTGIRSLVIFEKSYIPELSKNTFRVKFTGAGAQQPIEAEVSTNHNLRLCNDVVANQINAVILDQSNKYLHHINGIKIHGAFGYQIFARFQVMINYKTQLITLSEPESMDHLPGYEAIPISIHDTKPFIEMDFKTGRHKWRKLNLILDLGANHQVLLHENRHVNPINRQRKGNPRIAEGISGSIYGISGRLKQMKLGSVTYNDKEVLIPSEHSYVMEETSEIKKHGSLGGRFFDDSIIILDYINGLLFVKMNESHLVQQDYLANNQKPE